VDPQQGEPGTRLAARALVLQPVLEVAVGPQPARARGPPAALDDQHRRADPDGLPRGDHHGLAGVDEGVADAGAVGAVQVLDRQRRPDVQPGVLP
jgi:hypothetical protein